MSCRRLGAFCESPGKPYDGQSCEAEHSTCGGAVGDCHGRYAIYFFLSLFRPHSARMSWFSFRGPGFRISDFESNRIIGEAQFLGAQKVMNGPLSPVQGHVKSAHAYVTMFVEFPLLLLVLQLRFNIGLIIHLRFLTELWSQHVRLH